MRFTRQGGSFGGPGSRRRIDHLVASPAWKIDAGRYGWDFTRHLPQGQFPVGLPDHAMLAVYLSRRG